MLDRKLDAMRERAAERNKNREAYKGGPLSFRHLDNDREAAWPWVPDVEIAGAVRMLLRHDLDHEAVVCAARDRILYLSQDRAKLIEGIKELQNIWFTGPDLDKDAISQQCLKLFKLLPASIHR